MPYGDEPTPGQATVLVQIALAVVIALGGALLTRSVTTELTQTVGMLWPFSLAHCYGPASPGCEAPRSSEWHEATR
ncbi:MAG: hypothetical protein JO157_12150 [Acetobacteraceae bacterium]|nr:hypothetical protein [Acetobacteraceae bacterium]